MSDGWTASSTSAGRSTARSTRSPPWRATSVEAAVERSLAAARELLGMQLAYVVEVQDDEFRFRALDGDAAAFGGLAAGTRIPRRDTLCDRMLSGALGNVVPDVATAPGAQGTTSPGVGAYVGVPVQLGDGTVYGSLCCVSTQPTPALLDRDARVLEVLARIIADQIDRERQQRRSARLEGEATAGQALLAALKARERYTARALRGGRRARHRRRRATGPARTTRSCRWPRSRSCTTSASSACRRRSCRSRAA